MNDLISRKALLAEYDRVHTGEPGKARKLIEDAPAVTDNNVGCKWIPVTERLPKRMANKVIVRCKNDYIGFGHYENYKGKQTWYNLENDRPFTDWDLEDCESYEVTHWMPLPEPPKEG